MIQSRSVDVLVIRKNGHFSTWLVPDREVMDYMEAKYRMHNGPWWLRILQALQQDWNSDCLEFSKRYLLSVDQPATYLFAVLRANAEDAGPDMADDDMAELGKEFAIAMDRPPSLLHAYLTTEELEIPEDSVAIVMLHAEPELAREAS